MENAMTANSYQGSAKIYPFPVGGRAALASRRDVTDNAGTYPTSRFVKVAPGSAWYHEEAVQTADPRTGKM
jgi:Protein of unknown function (DUF2735)